MTMIINEQTIGMWNVALGERGNWLAHLARDDKGIVLTYRFRWYRDDKTYDSGDKKNWYRAESKTMNASQGIEVMRRTFNEIMAASARNKGWELLRGERSMDDFMTELFKMPGMHHKTIDADGNEVEET